MKTRSFIGKRISLQKLEELAEEIFPPGDYDDDYSVAELYLNNFDCLVTDRAGRNAYSIQLYLDHDIILGVQRIGHCHMCGGEGSDDELLRYPHKTLEEEAHNILSSLLK